MLSISTDSSSYTILPKGDFAEYGGKHNYLSQTANRSDKDHFGVRMENDFIPLLGKLFFMLSLLLLAQQHFKLSSGW